VCDEFWLLLQSPFRDATEDNTIAAFSISDHGSPISKSDPVAAEDVTNIHWGKCASRTTEIQYIYEIASGVTFGVSLGHHFSWKEPK
jgi:hypothetical protein